MRRGPKSGNKRERCQVHRSYDVEVPPVKRGERLEPETFGGCDDKSVGPAQRKVDVLLDEGQRLAAGPSLLAAQSDTAVR